MKQKIMVDMDDVITIGGFRTLINEYLGTNYKDDDFNGFYMQDILPDKETFFNWFKNKNVYDYCHLAPNVYEVLEYLNNKYDLYIGTSYIWREIVNDSGYMLGQKFAFLNKTFPFISPYKYIFLSDKSILNVDIKIDDRVDNLTNTNKKILFTAYHNKDIPDDVLAKEGIIRANNWLDIKNIL